MAKVLILLSQVQQSSTSYLPRRAGHVLDTLIYADSGHVLKAKPKDLRILEGTREFSDKIEF